MKFLVIEKNFNPLCVPVGMFGAYSGVVRPQPNGPQRRWGTVSHPPQRLRKLLGLTFIHIHPKTSCLC